VAIKDKQIKTTAFGMVQEIKVLSSFFAPPENRCTLREFVPEHSQKYTISK